MLKQIIFSVGCLSLIVWGANFLNSPRQTFNLLDTRLALYSDKTITDSAKIQDPRFRHLAFEPAPVTRDREASQLASIFSIIKSFFIPVPKQQVTEYGTWLWTPVLQMDKPYMQEIITKVAGQGVNVIYLSLDSYLDVFAEDGAERDRQQKLFSDTLDIFISIAHEKGIEVDAEAGWRNWAEPGHTYKGLAIADFVIEYNKIHQDKFRGFQYDVEPYLLENYYTKQDSFLKNFVQLVDDTGFYLRSKDSGLRLSVVVPDFYDKNDKVTPKFSYHNRRDYVLGHLYRVLDKNPGSSIIVMSYRNFAEGADGSIEVSHNELDSARSGRHKTKVILAQESGNVLPSYLTFYGLRKQYFLQETTKLKFSFENNPNFAGLAIHYANAFVEIK